MKLRVECYAGYKAGERPVRFYLDEREYMVEELLDQWYGPDYMYFRLRASDGNVYVLRHTIAANQDEWTLASFSSGKRD